MNSSESKIKKSLKQTFDLMNTPLMSILPGQISFFIILSIVPLASILVMIISKLSFNFDIIINFINNYIPKGVGSLILSIFESQRAGVIDVFFIIMAFYLASKATHSIIVASTQIYNGKQKNFLRTRIKAILLLVILVMLIVVLIGFLIVFGKLIAYLNNIGFDLNPFVYWAYKIFKWPLAFFMVFFLIKVIYTVAPNVNVPSHSVNKGALLTTIIWVISTYAFSFYVVNIANFSKFYGNLSNIIVLMLWIYWLCYIFVFGMTFNEYKLSGHKDESSEK